MKRKRYTKLIHQTILYWFSICSKGINTRRRDRDLEPISKWLEGKRGTKVNIISPKEVKNCPLLRWLEKMH